MILKMIQHDSLSPGRRKIIGSLRNFEETIFKYVQPAFVFFLHVLLLFFILLLIIFYIHYCHFLLAFQSFFCLPAIIFFSDSRNCFSLASHLQFFFLASWQLYDLHVGQVGLHQSTADGCPGQDTICASCPVNSTCTAGLVGTAVCSCNPGYRGDDCATGQSSRATLACHPGGHYWSYYPGALSLNQVTVTHLESRHPLMKIYRCPVFKWVAETWLHDRVPG